MADEVTYSGHCHCGNLEVAFTSAKPAHDLVLRCCQCSFCRRHGARCTSDPAGTVAIMVHDPALLLRYAFGLRTAEFLVCGRCGTYMGALMATDGGAVATINVNTFDQPHPLQGAGVPVSYEAESEVERRARRAAGWTPASIVTSGSGSPRQVSR